jgi:hypothetical protein
MADEMELVSESAIDETEQILESEDGGPPVRAIVGSGVVLLVVLLAVLATVLVARRR